MDIQDKVALVTGAGSGIGRAIALRLAVEGASVVVDDIDNGGGRETVRQIEEAGGGKAVFVRADVATGDGVERMIGFAEKTFGGLDILVNNAANEIEPPFFPDASADRWRRTLEVCLFGVMVATQQALKAMSERGGGAIVNISSMAGVGFWPHEAPEYAAAKAATLRLTATLAPLATSVSVRVNCICPNWVATEKVRASMPQMTKEQRAAWHVPAIDAMARPEDIADAVAYFLRDDSLAGRVMLCDERKSRWLIPVDADLFALGVRLQ